MVHLYCPASSYKKDFIVQFEGKGLKFLEYSDSAKIFNYKTGMNAIIVSGGSANYQQTQFSNTAYILDLFSKSPAEIHQSKKEIDGFPIIEAKILPETIHARAMTNAIAYKGKYFLIGGYVWEVPNAKAQQLTATCEYFDTQTGKWQQIYDLPEPRTLFNMTIKGNHLYIVGGYDQIDGSDKEKFATSILLLNLDNFKWEKLNTKFTKPVHFGGRGLCFFGADDKICIFGGRMIDKLKSGKYENPDHKEEFDNYCLSEICLTTGICTFTDIQLHDTYQEQVDRNKKEALVNLEDIYDYNAVYYNDRVYMGHSQSQGQVWHLRVIVYDDNTKVKLYHSQGEEMVFKFNE